MFFLLTSMIVSVTNKKKIQVNRVVHVEEVKAPQMIEIPTQYVNIEVKEQPMIGEMNKKDIEVCKTAIQKLNSNDQSVINKWNLIECSTQVVNGLNYRMKLQNPKNSQKTCNLNIYMNTKNVYELTNLHENDCMIEIDKPVLIKKEKIVYEKVNHEPIIYKTYEVVKMEAPKIEPVMLGGVDTCAISCCQETIKNLDTNLQEGLNQWKVKECQCQVVAGWNYFIKMENLKDSKRICSLSVYKHIDGSSEVRESYENDCAKEIQKDKANENVIVETIEMKAPEPIFIQGPTVEVKYTQQQEPKMLGGVEVNSIETCQTALKNIAKNLQNSVSNLKITECRTQVVAGIRYMMKMQNKKDRSKNCNFEILMTTKGEYEVQKISNNPCISMII